VGQQFFSSPEIVHNAVRLPDLSNRASLRDSFRRGYGIAEEDPLIGYVGRIDRGKGVDTLIDAFTIVTRRYPNCSLVIVGSGPEATSLRHRPPAGVPIIWHGFEKTPESVFAALDGVVVPSTEPDSFPRSAIEAMSWGLPVIGTASGGLTEAIIPGKTGSIVPPGDIQALAREMEGWLLDPARARNFGAAGRERCEKHFTAAQHAEQVERIYETVLRERR
jgi:glycosyltransferase involved in cell wall biosynthesis